MSPAQGLERKQIWNIVPSRTSSSLPAHCTPFTLPSNGIIAIGPSTTITITANAIFQPQCATDLGATPTSVLDPSNVADLRDPFYASTIPQAYAIAAATVLSYMLVILLFMTPRSLSSRGPTSGRRFLGGRGILSGATSGAAVIGVGRRPWLQKVAALTVLISLTIASADTFKVAKHQYEVGYMDATEMRDEVVGSVEIEVVRVISDTFLWLAQVQTLIRLFPRHKEKVIIKWAGFALIFLDTLFSILNSFVYPGTSRPRSFVDAIPALSYLFQLALSLLYAVWVIYYAITKRRFAFYHPRMRNICLVATLALISILVPVIFFVLDISNPSLAGWGDYFRWVGAAAASVVVWEWVERIEALERDERKDGVLGREIFDGDEMLDITPAAEINWPSHPWRGPRDGGPDSGTGQPTSSAPDDSQQGGTQSRTDNVIRFRVPVQAEGARQPKPDSRRQTSNVRSWTNRLPITVPHFRDLGHGHGHQNAAPSPPPAAVTPISRADTTSAASTVYAVHYHPTSESPVFINPFPPQAEPSPVPFDRRSPLHRSQTVRPDESALLQGEHGENDEVEDPPHSYPTTARPTDFDGTMPSPPPPPPAQAASRTNVQASKSLFGPFSLSGGRNLLNRALNKRDSRSQLPVTIIPAQHRGRLQSTLQGAISSGPGPSDSTNINNQSDQREENDHPDKGKGVDLGSGQAQSSRSQPGSPELEGPSHYSRRSSVGAAENGESSRAALNLSSGSIPRYPV
ncbi:MAG: Bifunctional purine biosynthetic protein ade1 [Chaenotheca gracillima]|nr:MAG: Bifunctional purine biosynthetic protein ade1 [Chaenotheca gracillima]